MLKPKMTMGEGDYITAAFRAEMDKWLADFFGYEHDDEPAAVIEHHHHNDADLVIAKTPPPVRAPSRPRKAKGEPGKARKASTSKTQVQPNTETFTALLDSLEDSFTSLLMPSIHGSWLDKRDVNAIKKMGVHIPAAFEIEFPKTPIIPAGLERPAIASALFIPKRDCDLTGDTCYPRFAYAIKGAKLPVMVEAMRGTPYQFGLCYELRKDEKGRPMPSKLFWSWCWVVVGQDGEIRIPHELRAQCATIKHKHRLPGLVGKGVRASTVHFRQWTTPSLAIAESGRDQVAHERTMLCTFRQLLLWWTERKEQWSVGVRKDGHRVTFSIAPEHTAAYFADRDTAVNVAGKPKKIIHFVREHTRVTGSTVKAHVRGLREFDWKGYRCAVTAPALNGAIFTEAPLDPVEVDAKKLPTGFISTEAMAAQLADMEDGPAIRIGGTR